MVADDFQTFLIQQAIQIGRSFLCLVSQVVFNSFLNAVFLGLWNPLEVFLLGIWLVGLGPFIQRERHGLGIVTRLLGFSAVIDSTGCFLDVHTIFFIGSSGLFLLVPVWLIVWAVDLLRKPVQIA